MTNNFQVTGTNDKALFTLKLHRGEGMLLIAMNWKKGKPSIDFVGFAIEYKEPGGTLFFALKNRLGFEGTDKSTDANKLSTLRSPIQKFRWVHFPYHADLDGEFTYRITPMFMNEKDELSKGEAQEANIELSRFTYPGLLNVCFTRGFVSSQAFIDNFAPKDDSLSTLLPFPAKTGLNFKPTDPKKDEAYTWMGFEARKAILELLDNAIADKDAQVRVVGYDFNMPEIVDRLKKLKKRLKIIIDNSKDHGDDDSAETQAATILAATAGQDNVKRQHMANLQHNKTIVVKGKKVNAVVCGSTNLSWRGFYVQANNAMIITHTNAVDRFMEAFDNYWLHNDVKGFGGTNAAKFTSLGLPSVDIKLAFSPHTSNNALLQLIADDIAQKATSSVLYSLAFLYEVPGPVTDAINKVTNNKKIFVYGISDKKAGGIKVQIPDGNVEPVYPSDLGGKNLPQPFKAEVSGGSGTRMHHKFVVIDFDKPTARVYFGSYNFSSPADIKNGENLLLVKDRRIAVSYMIEALRLFDHYHFRVVQKQAKQAKTKLILQKPPRKASEKPWWDEDYTDARKIKDRLLFS